MIFCLRKKVDAETYYQEKLDKIEAEWQFLKNRQNKENAGVAFVGFRDKNCVGETLEEINIVKSKLSGERDFD